MKKQQNAGAMGVSMGTASIVMVFAVLCLTLLSVMALVSANREWVLADNAAQAVTDYYAADSLAVRQYDEIRASGADSADFTVPIDENRSLCVSARRERDGWKILQWQVMSSQNWENEQGLEVWQGLN